MNERKQIRLPDFDYSSANSYFITICTNQCQCHFGNGRNGIMRFSDVGNIAAVYMQKIEDMRTNVAVDEFIVMPNHVHCLLDIRMRINEMYCKNHFARPVAGSVSIVINRYKGAVKKWCNENGYKHFEWQGRFYEHVIRDNLEYWNIKNYIINNPHKWNEDRFYRL